jgi:hypothetical protein
MIIRPEDRFANDPHPLVAANRAWLNEEAPYEERFVHTHSEAAAIVWRRIANKRLAARQAANTPW